MAELAAIVERMIEENARLLMRIAEVERRMDNTVRHGKVTDVDTEKQLARIEIGERDGKVLKSAWVPYGQIAGDYKSHRPPTRGQQMTMFAPNGEVRQALLFPFTWSDDNPSPSDKPDEHVDTYGDKFRIVRRKDRFSIQVDKASLTFTPESITADVDGARTVWRKEHITSTAPEVRDVGISKLGLTSEDADTVRAVAQDDTSSQRVLINAGARVPEIDEV